MKRTLPALLIAAGLVLLQADAATAQHAVFEAERYDSPESAPSVELRVFLTDASGGRRAGAPGETLTYRTDDVDATAGADYQATAGTVQFESGEESKTIRIPLLDDDLAEGVEAFTVHARNSLGGDESTTTVFLVDEEGPTTTDQFARSSNEPTSPATGDAADSPADRAEPPAAVESSPQPASPAPATRQPEADLKVGAGFELSTVGGEPTADRQQAQGNWAAIGGTAGALALVAAAAVWRRRSRWSPTRL